MASSVQDTLKTLPQKPGVYLYKNADGKLLYVGKAINLKNRVSSYFQKSANLTPRIQSLVSQINSIEIIVAQSEVEALVLESNLIKTHLPKYNILMKDDKKYPWLVFTNEPFPRLAITRDPVRGSKSFGPYASPGAMYETLQLIKKLFPLRQRKKPLFKDRPCMNYHIGACLGPCQSLISAEDYQKMVDQVVMLLKGEADTLLALLEAQMNEASSNMNYELAAELRDKIEAVETITERQRVMVENPDVELDAVGVSWHQGTGYFVILKVRDGKLVKSEYYTEILEKEVLPEEAYQAFVSQYYQIKVDVHDLPKDLVLQHEIEDELFLLEWLKQYKGKKARIVHPQRSGTHKNILDMAMQNAEVLKDQGVKEQQTRLRHDPVQALITLQEQLKLPNIPKRIECYDISHIQGTNTVASMVVFTDGVADKKEYRRFKIRTTEEGTPDDFKSMLEVMSRRFSKREEKGWPDPDLVIIDGGKGQLSSACKALAELGITDQPIVSLAKKFEEVFVPDQSHPIIISRNSMALFLLQRIRDEAHRFAITYHRTLRSKEQTKSFLDEVKGVGKVRKEKLLEHFQSADAVLNASVEELAEALGMSRDPALKLYRQLHPHHQVVEDIS